MLIRGVIRHPIEHHLETAGVSLPHEGVKVRQRAEHGVDGAIIGDVIAEIGHWRGVDRRDPDRIGAEPVQVIEPAGDTRQVADAIAVAIHERARVDLVDDAALPPERLFEHRHPPITIADANSKLWARPADRPGWPLPTVLPVQLRRIQPDRHRTVVDQLDLHLLTEAAGLHGKVNLAQPVRETVDERFRNGG